MNHNTFGHYLVGDKAFPSNIEAIQHDQLTNKGIAFYFHDDIYSKFNWSVEPTENLNELYARRARELREKYDYLVLHFSGGTDSTNILETFYKNQIHLDEIYIRGFWNWSDPNVTKIEAANQYAEMKLIAQPLAELVKKQYMPHVKITIQDISNYILDFWNNLEDCDINLVLSHFSPSTVFKADYDELNPEFRKKTESGLKVAHIMGMEKPDIYFENGKYYTRFLDKFIKLHVPPRLTKSQLPIYMEPFYWSETCAPMIIKQCHTVVNHIKRNRLPPNYHKTISLTEKHNWLASIIYDRTLPVLGWPEKGQYEVRETDWFFFKDKQAKHYTNWAKAIDKVTQTVQFTSDIRQGLTGVYSKSYCING